MTARAGNGATTIEPARHHSRRAVLRLGAASAGLALLAGCGGGQWNEINVAGASPPLRFTMREAGDGRLVTAADFHGAVTMVFLGYTFCPDVCPTTLANLAEILARLDAADADEVRVLFVTVDPDRDTLDVLKDYTGNFGPQFVGLRGTADQIAALARRYRLAYSVRPETAGHPYEVTHSSAIYVFDRQGNARLLISSLADGKPDIAGTAADLERLVRQTA